MPSRSPDRGAGSRWQWSRWGVRVPGHQARSPGRLRALSRRSGGGLGRWRLVVVIARTAAPPRRRCRGVAVVPGEGDAPGTDQLGVGDRGRRRRSRAGPRRLAPVAPAAARGAGAVHPQLLEPERTDPAVVEGHRHRPFAVDLDSVTCATPGTVATAQYLSARWGHASTTTPPSPPSTIRGRPPGSPSRRWTARMDRGWWIERGRTAARGCRRAPCAGGRRGRPDPHAPLADHPLPVAAGRGTGRDRHDASSDRVAA